MHNSATAGLTMNYAGSRLDTPGNPRRLAVWLFLFLTAAYALTSSGRIRSVDEYMMFFQTESLVLRHSLAIPQSLLFNNFFGVYDRFHEPRTPFPPGLALAASPAYVLGLGMVYALKLPFPQSMFLLHFSVCMTNAIVSSAMVTVVFLILVQLNFSCKTALITAFLVAFTTMLWPYSGYFFSEPLASLLLMLTAFVLFGRNTEPSGTQIPPRTLILAGFLLGALVWVRFYHAIALAAFCPALIAVEKRLRSAAFITGAVGLSFALYLAYNHYLFGGFFRLAYPKTVEAGIDPTGFSTPLWFGVAGFLFSPGKSVFLFMPVIAPAIWGVRRLAQRSRELALLAGVLPVIYLLFFANFVNWEGSRAPGPRFLLPPMMLLFLGLAPLLERPCRSQRIVVRIAGLTGLFVQLVSIATSFLEAHVGHGYFDDRYKYQFWYCQLTVQLRLLWHYAAGAPHRLGTGWDRWFIFLHDAGIPTSFIAIVLALECLAVLVLGYLVQREYRGCLTLTTMDSQP
jgi:hypothetical protein